MKKYINAAIAVAVTLAGGSAFAQTSTDQSQRDRIGAILGTLFGDRSGASTSIDAKWAAGQTPLTNQRSQFESRVNADVQTGALTSAVGARLKADYSALVQLEANYGADGRFTTQERTDLSDRYGALTQVLADRRYADSASTTAGEVATGRAEFDNRVNAAVTARRVTRVQGTRLKSDYAAIVQLEADYLRDGSISSSERDDLDRRLDALDTRLGDTSNASAVATPRARLDRIMNALPASGLSSLARAQLRVEHADLSRLEAAYARLTMTSDERAYLERRLSELETRARVRR